MKKIVYKNQIIDISIKIEFLKEFKASVQEVILAKQGKRKLQTAEELLNELQ